MPLSPHNILHRTRIVAKIRWFSRHIREQKYEAIAPIKPHTGVKYIVECMSLAGRCEATPCFSTNIHVTIIDVMGTKFPTWPST